MIVRIKNKETISRKDMFTTTKFIRIYLSNHRKERGRKTATRNIADGKYVKITYIDEELHQTFDKQEPKPGENSEPVERTKLMTIAIRREKRDIKNQKLSLNK